MKPDAPGQTVITFPIALVTAHDEEPMRACPYGLPRWCLMTNHTT